MVFYVYNQVNLDFSLILTWMFFFLLSVCCAVACPTGEYLSGYVTKFRIVVPGSFEEEIVPQCMPCPVTFYQPAKGALECLRCPEYQSTLGVGARASEECQGTCVTGVTGISTHSHGSYCTCLQHCVVHTPTHPWVLSPVLPVVRDTTSHSMAPLLVFSASLRLMMSSCSACFPSQNVSCC